MTLTVTLLIATLVFVVAVLYSTVGHAALSWAHDVCRLREFVVGFRWCWWWRDSNF